MQYEDESVLSPLESARLVFARQRAFAEHCFEQLDDERFFHRPTDAGGSPMNSVGIIAQHLAGNLLSRFTDFLTTDGEKPSRNREAEFSDPAGSGDLAVARQAIMERWQRGWQTLELTLGRLTDDDAARTVTIRSAPHSVATALARQLDHYGYHVGQIAYLSRMLVGEASWKWFTLAPGTTAAFNAALSKKRSVNPRADGHG